MVLLSCIGDEHDEDFLSSFFSQAKELFKWLDKIFTCPKLNRTEVQFPE